MQEASLSVNSLSQPTDSQRRDDMIAKLDHIRDLYETSKLNRVRYMAEARRAGLSFYEIGIVLGITDDAVRKAVARAGELD
jgi:sigma54-dependent transcription regulator